jgi:NADH-ubiquinone oxidoreductase chain 5
MLVACSDSCFYSSCCFTASILVTARVYLLIHFSPFKYQLNVILLLISGLTMFMAGLGVNSAYDSRRKIALPALRQLGLMIMNIFIGLFSLAFFHLLTHALSKVLLVICAGSVVHSTGDSHDIP